MEKTEVVYGLFSRVGIGDKYFIQEMGVFREEDEAREEWEYPINNGCWIEEIIIR